MAGAIRPKMWLQGSECPSKIVQASLWNSCLVPDVIDAMAELYFTVFARLNITNASKCNKLPSISLSNNRIARAFLASFNKKWLKFVFQSDIVWECVIASTSYPFHHPFPNIHLSGAFIQRNRTAPRAKHRSMGNENTVMGINADIFFSIYLFQMPSL